MSDNKDTLDKLIRRLQSPVFKFLIVKTVAGAYFADWLKRRLEHEIPKRKSVLLSVGKKNYRELMDTVYRYENGIVLIEDFDALLENKELTIGFNQRRDKFAALNIAIVAFVTSNNGVQKIMNDLPDLWSVRVPVAELAYTPAGKEYRQHIALSNRSNAFADMDTKTARENIEALHKRLQKLEMKEANVHLINSTYFRLMDSYDFLGHYNEAIKQAEAFKQLADTWNYPEKLPEMYAQLSNRLGYLYYRNGQHHKALNVEQKILEVIKDRLPDNHPLKAEAYINLAAAYTGFHQYEKALENAKKAMAIREAIYEDNHPELAQSYNSIAVTYDELGDYEKALMFHEKALAIYNDIYMENHPDLAQTYNNIANTYYSLKDYNKAWYYVEKALQIQQDVLHEGHPDIQITQNLQRLIAEKLANKR